MTTLNSVALREAPDKTPQDVPVSAVEIEHDPFLIALYREVEVAVAAEEQRARALRGPGRPDRRSSKAAIVESQRPQVWYAYD